MWQIVCFLKFLQRIPAYWRECERKYGYEPEVYGFIIQNYEQVLMELSGGRLSKPDYHAADVVRAIRDYYCEDCEYMNVGKE